MKVSLDSSPKNIHTLHPSESKPLKWQIELSRIGTRAKAVSEWHPNIWKEGDKFTRPYGGFFLPWCRASGDFETSRWLLGVFTVLAPHWEFIGEMARENVQATGKVGLSVGPGRRSLVYKTLKQKAFQLSAWSRFPLVLHSLAKPFPHFQAPLPMEWGEGCSQLFGTKA